MIDFLSPPAGGGKLCRRALPGKSVTVDTLKEHSTPKLSPGAPVRTLGRMKGDRLPNGAGAGASGRQASFYKGKVGYRIAPSSVTFRQLPPREASQTMQPCTKKAFQIRARRWAPK